MFKRLKDGGCWPGAELMQKHGLGTCLFSCIFLESGLVCGRPSTQVTAAASPFWPQSVLGSADFLLAASIPLPGAKGLSCCSHDLMSTGSSAETTHAFYTRLILGHFDNSSSLASSQKEAIPPLFSAPKPPVWRSFCSHHHQQPRRTQLEDQGSSAITNNRSFPLPFGLSLRLQSSKAWCIKILTRFVLYQQSPKHVRFKSRMTIE